jgi:hypothetical protein
VESWQCSINIYDRGDQQSYSVRMWKADRRGGGFLKPDKILTGVMKAPPGAGPTRSLQALLEALLAAL